MRPEVSETVGNAALQRFVACSHRDAAARHRTWDTSRAGLNRCGGDTRGDVPGHPATSPPPDHPLLIRSATDSGNTMAGRHHLVRTGRDANVYAGDRRSRVSVQSRVCIKKGEQHRLAGAAHTERSVQLVQPAVAGDEVEQQLGEQAGDRVAGRAVVVMIHARGSEQWWFGPCGLRRNISPVLRPEYICRVARDGGRFTNRTADQTHCSCPQTIVAETPRRAGGFRWWVV